jgi:hypothetical protein
MPTFWNSHNHCAENRSQEYTNASSARRPNGVIVGCEFVCFWLRSKECVLECIELSGPLRIRFCEEQFPSRQGSAPLREAKFPVPLGMAQFHKTNETRGLLTSFLRRRA